MSGPKVINIEAIRRQQERVCDRQLRQLRNAIEAWRDCLRRAGKLDEAADAEATALLARLEGLRVTNLSAALRELPSHVQFFRGEDAAGRKAIIARAQDLRNRRRRVEQSAAMLARELENLEEVPSAELQDAMRRANRADDDELVRLEKSVQRAFTTAAEVRGARRDAEKDARYAKLAAEFGRASESPQALRDWVTSKVGGSRKQREKEDRLGALLAEVEGWDDGEGVAPFVERARVISLEPASDGRELLTDSLILELSEYRKSQRRRKELGDRLHEAVAALEPYHSAEAEALRRRIVQEFTTDSLPGAEALAVEAEAWCTTEAKREDARLRREAVLKALSELGYEVREGMAVAWADEGRIVVKKPNDSNYGVELMNPGDATALQARVVAVDYAGRGEGDVVRDKEVEESWCSDLGKMQRLMADAGYEAAIRKATPAGSVKLKVVPGGAVASGAAPLNRVER